MQQFSTSSSDLLSGQVAFITGGAGGIGQAVAHAFLAHGARVVIGDIEPRIAAAASELEAASPDRVRAVKLDVTDEAETAAVVSGIFSTEGSLDVVVPNAGILHLAHAVATPADIWRRVLEVNLTGAFLTATAAARSMMDAGKGGRIVFTSSLFGLRGGVENAAYSASKFGMNGLMQCMAAELAPQNIRVNCVCPGQMDTEMLQQLFHDRAVLRGVPPQKLRADFEARIPMGALGKMSELAGTYVYLASSLSDYVTGQNVTVDGGWQVG